MEPVHIQTEGGHTPVQHKRRVIALDYKETFREHLDELKSAGVAVTPLGSEWATGRITKVVIMGKSWINHKIRDFQMSDRAAQYFSQ